MCAGNPPQQIPQFINPVSLTKVPFVSVMFPDMVFPDVAFPDVAFPGTNPPPISAVMFCPCAITVFREPVIRLGKVAAVAVVIVAIIIITNMLCIIGSGKPKSIIYNIAALNARGILKSL